MLSHLGHWSALGFGYWAVEERASGRLVGELGFADFKRGLDARLEGVPEAGWALAQHAHGKGYATEALGAALAWADARLGPRTVCIVHADNHASLRLAAKMRYLAFDRVTAGGREDLLLARDAPTG